MKENKLKPFDIKKAKAGAKLVTRDGRNARIICWDRVDDTFPIVALVDGKVEEVVVTFTNQGIFLDDGAESCYDLFMAPTTVERWVNVYKSKSGTYSYCFHESEEMALQNKDDKDYITTAKISWEE